MNQPHEGKRLFSYAEAVALLPLVRQVTDEAHGRVERLLATAADGAHTREQAQSIVNAWEHLQAGLADVVIAGGYSARRVAPAAAAAAAACT